MKWVKEHDPEADGRYIVLEGYGDTKIDTITFTVEGGWNTFRTLPTDELYAENAMDCHVGEEESWISAWLILDEDDPWEDGKPKEDGYYIVNMQGYYDTMTYSAEHGWNALYNPKNRIEDESVTGWMTMETAKEALN